MEDGGDEERGTESMEERESEAGERRGKETDIKRETEDVGLGRRLAAAAAAPLDVRRVRNYRFSERLARSASRARFESLRGPSLVAPSRALYRVFRARNRGGPATVRRRRRAVDESASSSFPPSEYSKF